MIISKTDLLQVFFFGLHALKRSDAHLLVDEKKLRAKRKIGFCSSLIEGF